MSIERLNELMPPGPTPRYYPSSLFRASPTQPRRRVKPAKVEEMRASIEQAGQQQAILARPNPEHTEGDGQPPLEIVFGHQRWEAIGGLESGPGVLANVRELTDQQVKQIQMIENMDREDLHPYDEAAGLQRLLRSEQNADGFASVDELAAWLRKSRRWVYQRLSLTRLCEKAREAFLDDKINASVAALLARMDDQDQQLEATEKILAGWGGDPYSFRAAAKLLQDQYMLNLGSAPFDITATFEIAGPCGQCPKRSGAKPDLFAELEAGDMCQDSACFHAKSDESHERSIEQLTASGQKVLRGEEAVKFWPWAPAIPPSGHLNLDMQCKPLTTSDRTLRELLGNRPKGVVTVEHPHSKDLITVVPHDQVVKALKTKGLLRESSQPKPAPKNEPAGEAAPKPRTAQSLAQEAKERATLAFGRTIAFRMRDALRSRDSMPVSLAREIALMQTEDLSIEATQLLFDLQGWPHDSRVIGPSQLNDQLARLEREQDLARLFEVTIHGMFVEALTDEYVLDDVLDSAEEGDTLLGAFCGSLDLASQFSDIHASELDKATAEVAAEEDKRLGRTKPKDATDAFVEAHAPASGKAAAKKSSVKYRKQDTGESWSGRGLQPAWLKKAISDGGRLEDFEVTA